MPPRVPPTAPPNSPTTAPTEGSGTASPSPEATEPSGPEEYEGDALPEGSGGAWFLIPVAIAIVALVALAAFWFLPVYLHSQGSPGPTGGGTGMRQDLCAALNGSNCEGNQASLPWNDHGASLNVTACDQVQSRGSDEVLWLNYTSSTTVVGIVIPASLYYGATGWFEDPSGFANNSSAKSRSVWYSGYYSGTNSAAVPIPDDGQLWCVGWWEPSGPVTIQWQSDLAITYFHAG